MYDVCTLPCIFASIHSVVAFVFVHDGHCAEGYLGDEKRICATSLTACADYCNANTKCGYFTYTTSCNNTAEANVNCALYSVDFTCTYDGKYSDFKAYRLSSRNGNVCALNM